MIALRTVVATLCLVIGIATPAIGQASSRPCPPVAQRSTSLGTCRTAVDSLGPLPRAPMFWHIDAFPSRAAATIARGPRSTVVESLGKTWLFTIDESSWRPRGGRRVGIVGPLPVEPGVDYTAVYMQSIFTPGTVSPVHTHAGPEAFFTLSGGTCLETPEGLLRGDGPNNTLIVRRGPPMELTATGAVQRRGLVLILHDSSQPATTPVEDWKPKGLCKR